METIDEMVNKILKPSNIDDVLEALNKKMPVGKYVTGITLDKDGNLESWVLEDDREFNKEYTKKYGRGLIIKYD